MSVQPLGNPLFRAFDSNGAPLSGGLLYAYSGGTSTPLATYTDSTGTVANANPVVLDSTGEAQVWMAPGVLYKFVLQNSLGVQQWSVDNFPSPAATATGNTQVAVNDPGGRLTFLSTLPVSGSDLTSQNTAYYVPYKSDQVPLYNGSSWSLYSIGASGVSQALTDTLKSPGAAANSTCYDLFVWLDGSTVRLSRGPAWITDTTRGTGAGTTQLTRVNGRYVNAQTISNGPSANLGLYVGTLRTDGSAQGNDSLAKRHLWNAYSRVPRPMSVLGTSTWSYAGAWRQANATAGYQLDYVVGLAEDEVYAETKSMVLSGTSTSVVATGVGSDSTTVASGLYGFHALVAGANLMLTSSFRGIPGLGRHYLAWLEYGNSAGSATFYGAGSPNVQSGILGSVPG